MPDIKKFEKQFFAALSDIFIGAKVEGDSGYINLMRIKARYYENGVFPHLTKDIDAALQPYPDFREELFDKLYTFFQRYFSESGSIYFRYTALHQNVYEKVYTNDRDVILFWKTHMLYYVKTDRIFTSLAVEVDGLKFFFAAGSMTLKKSNEKRQVVYNFRKAEADGTLVFDVAYSEKGKSTKVDDILKAVKQSGSVLGDETLEKACRVFEKQSEVDYFINKDARSFLRDQFDIWLYQYLFAGQNVWSAERIAQLQTLKAIAFKVIDFISQFEDELVKVWNKPKFVRNSHYVITLDKIVNPPAPPLERGARGDSGMILLEKICTHPGMAAQIDEWHNLGMVDEDFKPEDILFIPGSSQPYTPDMFAAHTIRDGGLLSSPYFLPYNPDLVERARQLRKNMTPAERKLWNEFLRNFRYPVLRQRPIDQYIVDFYCARLKLVIEVDGGSHYTEDGQVYDEHRTQVLESYGLRVMRFTNTQVLQSFEAVCQEIESTLDLLSRTGEAESPLDPPLGRGEEESPLVLPLGKEEESPLIPLLGREEESPLDPPLGRGEVSTPPLKRGVGGDSLNPQYQFLPLDTKHFPDLELDILSQFDDLDAALDGWLVHSENYQALNTLLPKFKNLVNCIFIDPPYNTGSDDFIYKDNFRSASWLALIVSRLQIAQEWLNKSSGAIFIAIDENEFARLKLAAAEVFGPDNFTATIIWQKVFAPKNTAKYFSYDHDYILVFAKDKEEWSPFLLQRSSEAESRYENPDNDPRGVWASSDLTARNYYSEGTYEVISPSGRTFTPTIGTYWRFSHANFDRLNKEGRIWWGPNGNNMPRLKRYLAEVKSGVVPQTLWKHEDVGNTQEAKKELLATAAFERSEDVLNTVKPTRLIKRVIEISTGIEGSGIVFDFFAGGGSTAHAVMNLNREDGGKRKYILVEMGEHFNTVILPRIKKIAFCSKWKDGKPLLPPLQRGARGDSEGGLSHFVKYYELEQYEDVLRRARYQDADLFDNPYEDPYHRYVFLRDVKLLDSLEVDLAQNKVHFHPERIYPKNPPLTPPLQGGNQTAPPLSRGVGGDLPGGDSDIDLAETLSTLRGKWIKRITAEYVEFQDGERLSLTDPDWRILKPLIWWQ